jgi:hypothetical protein
MIHYNSFPHPTRYDSLNSYNELSRLHSYEPNLCVMSCSNLTQGSNSTPGVCTKIQPHCFSLTIVHKYGASSEILFGACSVIALACAVALIMKLQSEMFPLFFLLKISLHFVFLYSANSLLPCMYGECSSYMNLLAARDTLLQKPNTKSKQHTFSLVLMQQSSYTQWIVRFRIPIQ